MFKTCATALSILCLPFMAVQPVQAQQKKTAPAKPADSAQQKQIADLQAALNALKQDHSELERQLEEARIQNGQVRDELDRLKATLKENQSGGDSLLKQLQQAKGALAKSEARVKALEDEAASLRDRVEDTSAVKDGTLAHFGPDIVPAECLNLRRMTPNTKRVSGVVVVNVLISERGEPLDVRLVQKLPGDETEWTTRAHNACLEAAKRLVFRPATTKDGSIRLKVWQGVGFELN